MRRLSTSVVQRAFAVMGAFDRRRSRLTLSELVACTGLRKTTVHRMAVELAELGALERRNGGYALGPRLFELGQLAPRHSGLRDLALPYMQDLYEATRETVQLAVLDGFEVVYVEMIHGHRRASTQATRGGRMPFHCTALGKATVAFSSRETLAQALTQPLPRLTPRTITDRAMLQYELARVRSDGVAFDRGESQRGLVCAAAPIIARDGAAVAAVSVAMSHRSRATLGGTSAAVTRAARAISRALQSSPISFASRAGPRRDSRRRPAAYCRTQTAGHAGAQVVGGLDAVREAKETGVGA
jgi:IclR family acetate operon transcriptional repressor